jgi:hypothetical protein
MHDEFRVTVGVEDPREFLAALKSLEQEDPTLDDLARVAVTHEDDHVFLYADSQQVAEHLSDAVKRAMGQAHLQGEIGLWRWHPIEERWEDASTPLPADTSQRAAEHERLEHLETDESIKAGYPEWEIRITLPSHADARSFAERLQSEGIPVTRRWRHLILGANDEDDARTLAERVRAQAPAGSEILCEGSGLPYWNMLNAPARRFAFFGGLAQ